MAASAMDGWIARIANFVVRFLCTYR